MQKVLFSAGGRTKGVLHFTAAIALAAALSGSALAAAETTPASLEETARRIDALIEKRLAEEGRRPAPAASDEEFLRRLSLDLRGRPATADEVTLFVLDPDPAKRTRVIREFVRSEAFARRWARYWRDVIFYRLQDQRVLRSAPVFERWLAGAFRQDKGWDEIARELITATGPIDEDGRTALIAAQAARPVELAAETSRIFLGIQIQCAQCHDHPYDDWKREQFHQLAAFFPRVRLQRRAQGGKPSFEVVSNDPAPRRGPRGLDPKRILARFDRNRDGRIARSELPEKPPQPLRRLLKAADRDGNGVLTRAELERISQRLRAGGRRGGGEHRMPDLEHPEEPGRLMHPVFFITGESPGEFRSDLERRRALAAYITSEKNPWFAKAVVNRVWAEMTGRGFVEPVDDLGPGRNPAFGEVFELLARGFRANGYKLSWLVETIALTRAYQRRSDASGVELADGFGAVCPSRLSADELRAALVQALGLEAMAAARGRGPGRDLALLFGYDPSTPPDEIAGTVPQALFLMNSPLIEARISARGDTPLARMLRRVESDRAVAQEIYLQVLGREPRPAEIELALEHVRKTGERERAFEDLYWCLINSTEFLYRR